MKPGNDGEVLQVETRIVDRSVNLYLINKEDTHIKNMCIFFIYCGIVIKLILNYNATVCHLYSVLNVQFLTLRREMLHNFAQFNDKIFIKWINKISSFCFSLKY